MTDRTCGILEGMIVATTATTPRFLYRVTRVWSTGKVDLVALESGFPAWRRARDLVVIARREV